MNLFEKTLSETGAAKKVTIQGMTKTFPVFRIPLDYLVYNKKNGRIATYVSQFIDEGNEFPTNNNEEFNKIIEGYIEKSNLKALKKTKKNIQLMQQIEPAVVLSNGIVLDGNRRFTSLRQLSREGAGAEFGYLEAIILEEGKYSEKDIKRLELNLQHATEARVEYNPIDRLVDVYRDVIKEPATFTVEEYATEINESKSAVRNYIRRANLMIEYLEYIGQPLKFYIARDQQIDGPINDAIRFIDDDTDVELKEFLFLNILSLGGDRSRNIREVGELLKNSKLSLELLEELEDSNVLEEANDYFESDETKELVSKTGVLNLDKEIKEKLLNVTEAYVEKDKLSNAQHQPIELLNKTYSLIKEVDYDAVQRMNEELKTKFFSVLTKIEEKVNNLKDENAV